MLRFRLLGVLFALAFLLQPTGTLAQTMGSKEEFSANAIRSDNLGSGAGRVIIRVERWSTPAEQESLTQTLMKDGPQKLLDALQHQKPVGSIRTPDSIGYDLHYASQAPTQEGGRRIVMATDRPIGFWEAANQPRTIDYPFTVIQIELDQSGEGKGTLSCATKIQARANTIELENFTTAPVMLTNVQARPIK